MNQLEARSHIIQTKQRAKSRESDRHSGVRNRASPGSHEGGVSKERDEGGSARVEARLVRVGEDVSMAEAEEAVKKIYLITGEQSVARSLCC
jgi:hypothetical protein